MVKQLPYVEPRSAKRDSETVRFILNTDAYLIASKKLSPCATQIMIDLLALFGRRGFPSAINVQVSFWTARISEMEIILALNLLIHENLFCINTTDLDRYTFEIKEASRLVEKTF